MAIISSHILDSVHGCSASGIRVQCQKIVNKNVDHLVFEIEANGSKLDLIDFSAAEVFANKSPNRTSRLCVVRGKYGRITSDADNTILAYSTLNYLKIGRAHV